MKINKILKWIVLAFIAVISSLSYYESRKVVKYLDINNYDAEQFAAEVRELSK